MTIRTPLSAASEVVNTNRRWTQDWYTWLSDLSQSINDVQSAFIGGFVRADIALTSSTVLPDTLMVSGYSTVGDLGTGAIYTRVGASSGGVLAIQTTDGVWYNLVLGRPFNVGWFGAKGDGSTDDAAAIQAAMDALPTGFPNQGGEIFFPNGVFVYGTTITWSKDYVLWSGGGAGSILQAHNSAQVKIGDTATLNNVLFPQIQNLDFAAEGNHSGAILVLDLVQNATVQNCIVGVRSNDGSTQTDGIRLNSCQFVVIDNVQSLVNGYSIHIFLGTYTSPFIPENEGHYTIRNSFLYGSKTLKAGSFPSGVAIERVAGRSLFAGVDQLSIEDTHMGNFSSGGALYAGIRLINENSVSSSRLTKSALVSGCMFEGCDYGWSANTAATADVSSVSFRNCYWLGNTICIQGTATSESFYQIDGCSILQCTKVLSQARGWWYGLIDVNSVGSLYDNPLEYVNQRFSNDVSFGVFAGTCLKNTGESTIGNGIATTFTIAHGLTSEGVAINPFIVLVQPGVGLAGMTWYISAFATGTFDVTFSAAPAPGSFMMWYAEAQTNN